MVLNLILKSGFLNQTRLFQNFMVLYRGDYYRQLMGIIEYLLNSNQKKILKICTKARNTQNYIPWREALWNLYHLLNFTPLLQAKMLQEFDTQKIIKKLRQNQNEYFHTFINKETLAGGIIVLQPGEKDIQTPHEFDELYYIVAGDGYLRINKKDYDISKGKVFFVRKNIEHFFFGNKKELVVLYFFGGPDS